MPLSIHILFRPTVADLAIAKRPIWSLLNNHRWSVTKALPFQPLSISLPACLLPNIPPSQLPSLFTLLYYMHMNKAWKCIKNITWLALVGKRNARVLNFFLWQAILNQMWFIEGLVIMSYEFLCTLKLSKSQTRMAGWIRPIEFSLRYTHPHSLSFILAHSFSTFEGIFFFWKTQFSLAWKCISHLYVQNL